MVCNCNLYVGRVIEKHDNLSCLYVVFYILSKGGKWGVFRVQKCFQKLKMDKNKCPKIA